MHELGVVFHVIKTVEEAAKENRLTEIEAVTLQIGEVSGVVESYLRNCWKWAVEKRSEILKDSALVVEQIPAVTYGRARQDLPFLRQRAHIPAAGK